MQNKRKDPAFKATVIVNERAYIKAKRKDPAFNPFLPSGLFYLYQMNESICKFRGVWCTLYIFNFIFDRNSC